MKTIHQGYTFHGSSLWAEIAAEVRFGRRLGNASSAATGRRGGEGYSAEQIHWQGAGWEEWEGCHQCG